MTGPPVGLLCVFFIVGVCNPSANAQEDSVQWEMELPVLEVTSDWLNPFTIGNALQTIEIETGKNSLADALREESSIYLRDYGNQQLSSISFRGTSASQTQVLWHGLPVNSPALGQSDLSTWPLGLLSELAIHPGNSGSLYGSGAIGGAVLINPSILREQTSDWTASLSQGSFGRWSGALSADVLKNELQFSTKLQASTIQNDFLIRSSGLREPTTQTNAEVNNLGFSQGLTWNKNHQTWHAEWIYSKNDRQVQPGITALSQQNTLITTANRSVITQEIQKKKWQAKTSAGWMLDETIYNDSLKTPSQQLSVLHRSNFLLREKWIMQVGALFRHASVNSDQLATAAVQTQWEPFTSITWYPATNLQVIANSRWLGSDRKLQWIPALSMSYDRLFGIQNLNISSSWSSGYRYPTLNDLYWVPGGNLNLVPEQSQQLEAGISWKHTGFLFDLKAFDIQTQDQIIWLPNDQSIWSPINVRSTRNRGLEGKIQLKKRIGKISHRSTVAGSWIKATLREENMPLPYVPNMQVNWTHKLKMSQWKLKSHLSYTSLRFTTLDGLEAFSLPQFVLLNLSSSYETAAFIKKKSLVFTATVRNVTNRYYELQSNLAMPGINYELQITIN